jgi:hypothetical protein
LGGYVIDRVTPLGQPVYKPVEPQIGDHLLDALMLSVVGFVLEVSPFGKVTHSSQIMFSGRIGEHTESPIFQGDTVIKQERKQDTIRETSRPSMDRTNNIECKSLLGTNNSLPGAHIVQGQQLGLWDYPGFSTDAPRPKVRTLTEAEGQARSRLGFSRNLSSKPRRKNI